MRAETRRGIRPVAAVVSHTVPKAELMPPAGSHDDAASSRSIARDCALLALIGLAAVVIAFALPADDRTRSPDLRERPFASQPTPAAAANALQSSAEEHVEPAPMPFEYFPAQFPPPRGEVEEQPATF